MWAKILAGAVAALLVVGFGVYVALPPGATSSGNCGTCCENPAADCHDAVGVCLGETASSSEPGCCPACAAKPVNADALAACLGGMAVSPEPASSARTNSKIKCCTEE